MFSIAFYLVILIAIGEVIPVRLIKNFGFNRGSEGHMYTRLNELDSINDVDILILGSSHAYRGYDPRIFEQRGYSIFNLGSSSQTFIQSEFLLKKFSQLKPKLVILDVYPILFESDGVESSLDLISNYKFPSDLSPMIFKQNSIKLYNTFVFSLYKNTFFNNYGNEPIVKGDDEYISGGFLYSSSTSFKDEPLFDREISINESQLESFISIINFLERKRIKYVIIQAPTTLEKNNHFTNISDLDTLFSNKGFYLNYNNILLLDHSYFLDHSHLNYRGVKIFNKCVIDTLEQLEILSKRYEK